MDASFVSKRPPDSSLDPTVTTKRRLHPPPTPLLSPPSLSTPSPTSFSFKPSPPTSSSSETLFRLLCPSSKTPALKAQSASIIRHLTAAKIHIDDSTDCDESVILIIVDSFSSPAATPRAATTFNVNDRELCDHESNTASLRNVVVREWDECSPLPAQQALLSVFESMMKVDEKRVEEKDRKREENLNPDSNSFEIKGVVSCRLLAPSNQVGCVLGRGGKIVEKIRQDTGALIRVLPKDNIPACASSGDELIQITGNFPAVKKALLSLSSCLVDNLRIDVTNLGATKPLGLMSGGNDLYTQVDPFHPRECTSGLAIDSHMRGHFTTGSENTGAGYRMGMEEDIVFKLLCQHDKVGSLIGKGGCVIRALQSETGASIKILDASPDSEERIVMISARESLEQMHSPAQEAVIRVHCQIEEIGFEPGAVSVARLLVHSNLIGCLLGKGGSIITEMRRATGANIRVFQREQVPKCGSYNDELVQVIGSLQSVQDALFHITSRLRETIFPMGPPQPNFNNPPFCYPSPEMHSPLFRQRHNPPSQRYYPPTGFPDGIDRSGIPSRPPDHNGYPYDSERLGPSPTLGPSTSPRSWAPQADTSRIPWETSNVGFSLAFRNGQSGSTYIEVVIPKALLRHVYGEKHNNLAEIREISGANVVVHDPNPGTLEGKVVVSGTPERTYIAQSLIHAFILLGKTSS